MNRVRGQAWQLFAVALWLLLPVGRVGGQTPDPALTRLVRPAPGTRPLGLVLAELSRQGHLPLSYSSSRVPVAHLCNLPPGPARPLGVVLKEVLAAEHLSFGLLNGQLVLWPALVPEPGGVAGDHGRPARTVQINRLPVAAVIAPIGTAGRSLGGRYALIRKSGGAFSSTPKHSKGVVARPEMPISKGNYLIDNVSSYANGAATRPPRPLAISRSSTAARNATPSFPAKIAASRPHIVAIVANQPGAALRRPRRRTLRLRVNVGAKPAFATAMLTPATRVPSVGPARSWVARGLHPGIGRAGGLPQTQHSRVPPQQTFGTVGTSVAPLTSIAIVPVLVLKLGGLPSSLPAPAGSERASMRSFSAGADNSVLAVARNSFTLTGLLRPGYLHAEAWVSETLPLNAAVKVGSPCIYLVLSVAAAPPGRQSGGAAGGLGLGTVGQARGRFTPSLDLIQWFLSGDRDTPGNQLLQLRPLLAWQTKPGGRLQIIGGPTLNLATGMRRPVGRSRGDGELGQGQWFWLDSGDEHTFRRLWPGMELGLRF